MSLLGVRIASAQARSFLVSGPQVSRSASSSISVQAAASERAFATACLTNTDMFSARPAATSAEISYDEAYQAVGSRSPTYSDPTYSDPTYSEKNRRILANN